MSANSNRQKEIRELLDGVKGRDGWSVEETGRHFKVYPPSGPMLTISRTPSDHRAIANARALLRRSGLDDTPQPVTRAALAIAPAPAPEPAQPVAAPHAVPGLDEVVERVPATKGGGGVHELLLGSGDVVYGCAEPGCAGFRSDTLFGVIGHRRAHAPRAPRLEVPGDPFSGSRDRLVAYLQDQITAGAYGPPGSQLPSIRRLSDSLNISFATIKRAINDLAAAGVVHTIEREGAFINTPTLTRQEPPMTAPAPKHPVIPAPAPSPETVNASNGDLHDLLTRAGGLLQRVDDLIQGRPDQSARITELERDLAFARARVGELEEKAARVTALEARIASMEQGARLLLGGFGDAAAGR